MINPRGHDCAIKLLPPTYNWCVKTRKLTSQQISAKSVTKIKRLIKCIPQCQLFSHTFFLNHEMFLRPTTIYASSYHCFPWIVLLKSSIYAAANKFYNTILFFWSAFLLVLIKNVTPSFGSTLKNKKKKAHEFKLLNVGQLACSLEKCVIFKNEK